MGILVSEKMELGNVAANELRKRFPNGIGKLVGLNKETVARDFDQQPSISLQSIVAKNIIKNGVANLLATTTVDDLKQMLASLDTLGELGILADILCGKETTYIADDYNKFAFELCQLFKGDSEAATIHIAHIETGLDLLFGNVHVDSDSE